jgi:hypothetical protein
MNYPVWDVEFGAGIAPVSIPHVFASHFAVVGWLFLVLTERRALRQVDNGVLTCREEIPGFVRLAESEPHLDIAGIAMDDDGAAEVRQFVKAAGVPYPILLPTAPSALVDAIQSLRTTFLVDKEGRVAQRTFAPSIIEPFDWTSAAYGRMRTEYV